VTSPRAHSSLCPNYETNPPTHILPVDLILSEPRLEREGFLFAVFANEKFGVVAGFDENCVSTPETFWHPHRRRRGVLDMFGDFVLDLLNTLSGEAARHRFILTKKVT
jgi:hypothetical protein